MGAAFRNIRNRKNRERVRSSLRPFSAGLRSTQAKAGLLTRFRRDAFPTARSVARDCRDDSPEHPGRNSQQRELLQTCTAFPFNPCGRAAREPFAGAKVAISGIFPNSRVKIRPFHPASPTSGKNGPAARPFPAPPRPAAASHVGTKPSPQRKAGTRQPERESVRSNTTRGGASRQAGKHRGRPGHAGRAGKGRKESESRKDSGGFGPKKEGNALAGTPLFR